MNPDESIADEIDRYFPGFHDWMRAVGDSGRQWTDEEARSMALLCVMAEINIQAAICAAFMLGQWSRVQ